MYKAINPNAARTIPNRSVLKTTKYANLVNMVNPSTRWVIIMYKNSRLEIVVTANPIYPVILKGINEKEVKELMAKLNRFLKEKVDAPLIRSGESKVIDVFSNPIQSIIPRKNLFRSGKVCRASKTLRSNRRKSVALC